MCLSMWQNVLDFWGIGDFSKYLSVGCCGLDKLYHGDSRDWSLIFTLGSGYRLFLSFSLAECKFLKTQTGCSVRPTSFTMLLAVEGGMPWSPTKKSYLLYPRWKKNISYIHKITRWLVILSFTVLNLSLWISCWDNHAVSHESSGGDQFCDPARWHRKISLFLKDGSLDCVPETLS